MGSGWSVEETVSVFTVTKNLAEEGKEGEQRWWAQSVSLAASILEKKI